MPPHRAVTPLLQVRPPSTTLALPGGGSNVCKRRPAPGQGANLGHSAQLAMGGSRVFIPDLGKCSTLAQLLGIPLHMAQQY